MIVNERVLFVHVPKTGGMAVTTYLLGILPRPVWYTHPDHDSRLDDGVIQRPGIRHETLAEAFDIAAEQGIDADRLPLVFGVLRNPYAMEVSRFAYLQKGHAWDAGPNQNLALAGDFTAFALHSTDHGGTTRPISAYFEIDGRIPDRMTILRHESLHDDLPRALRAAGIDVPPAATLAAENESRHGPWQDYYTRPSEAAVHARYRWVFDHGFYPRLDSGHLPDAKETPVHGNAIRLCGPIRQAGPITGVWHDGWAERHATVPLLIEGDVAAIMLHGKVPHVYAGGLEVTVTAGDSAVRHHIAGPTSFAIRLPATRCRGDRLRLTLEASASFCPHDENAADTRHLAYILSRIDAVEASA